MILGEKDDLMAGIHMLSRAQQPQIHTRVPPHGYSRHRVGSRILHENRSYRTASPHSCSSALALYVRLGGVPGYNSCAWGHAECMRRSELALYRRVRDRVTRPKRPVQGTKGKVDYNLVFSLLR